MRFLRTIRDALAALMLPEGRRAWALVLLAGAAVMMTAYAAVAMVFVRAHASFVLYLGLAAHFSIIVAITGFAGLLVKRNIVAAFGKDRTLQFSDQADAAAQAADKVAGAASDAADEVKEGTKP